VVNVKGESFGLKEKLKARLLKPNSCLRRLHEQLSPYKECKGGLSLTLPDSTNARGVK